MCVLGAAYVFWFVPETKGRTLDEIDELFGDRSGRAAHELEVLHQAYEEVGLTEFVGGANAFGNGEKHSLPTEMAENHPKA